MPERRSLYTPAIENRGVKIETREDGKKVAVGYAAVFYRAEDPGTTYKIWDDIHERIQPGAFDRALRERQDIRGLFNHNPSLILGRTKSGTTRLSVDQVGLRYEIDLPDTTVGRDTQISLERGDVDGSSFSFLPRKTTWREQDKILIRELEDVDLFDVGPVTFPAYQSTSSGIRSTGGEDLREEAQRYRLNKGQAVAVDARFREVQQKNN